MRSQFMSSILCVSLLALTLSLTLPLSSARAYDGLKEDFAACTQGSGKIANTQIVQACTRLIDNAAKQNSLTGYFFAMRAIANTDKDSNCRDARRAIRLLDNAKLINHAKTLEKMNCKN